MAVQMEYKTVGAIKGTNMLCFRPDASGWSIGYALLSSHLSGAPVVDDREKLVGFVSEFDLFKAMEAGKDVKTIRARDIMNPNVQAVSDSTPIDEAVKLMEDKHLLNLPVVRDGKWIITVSRHDLLRVSLGVDLGIEYH